MVDELIKKLLEAGVHFGHQTKRWNPKMKRFIFGQRSGIYIIDLEKTVDHLNRARDFIYEVASKGGKILFVGTKKQAQGVIEEEAKRVGMYYVNNRWMGGLLTNLQTVKKSIERLKSIERMKQDGIFEQITKKEVARLTKEHGKLMHGLGGILDMVSLPQAIFIVDTKKEEIAVKEARRLKIPIIGLIDTNCDPDVVDYPVPGNDDALKSVKFITALIADSVAEGRKAYLTSETVAKQKEPGKEAGQESAVLQGLPTGQDNTTKETV
ncbi:MAG: 30S ribosomal protein S2 [Omnitrophica WOR_2 bacterium RIFCSPHIGHO2_01_FULL_48_9]|nr:MAG: 30S ribosomal protein S2 [Omnitrophica WOR_2 bacterium RIFCSPHIGHO2_02_FULL_48_11]OGX34517.1 MAG: 30S ribosomal protein S2 [Omnitrophica WOR_2 bacterium RIFCSPHIGHO2_01_FULL_48_9]